MPGKPEPAGSKTAIPFRRKATGRLGVSVMDANPKAKSWQAEVIAAGYLAMATDPDLFVGPLGLSLQFYLRRPKGHYGAGRLTRTLVRPSAPKCPVTKPDLTKLVRAVEDALTGVVWGDDAQVVEQFVTKRYEQHDGVHVVVWTV